VSAFSGRVWSSRGEKGPLSLERGSRGESGGLGPSGRGVWSDFVELESARGSSREWTSGGGGEVAAGDPGILEGSGGPSAGFQVWRRRVWSGARPLSSSLGSGRAREDARRRLERRERRLEGVWRLARGSSRALSSSLSLEMKLSGTISGVWSRLEQARGFSRLLEASRGGGIESGGVKRRRQEGASGREGESGAARGSSSLEERVEGREPWCPGRSRDGVLCVVPSRNSSCP
jgi:hypothetical protein